MVGQSLLSECSEENLPDEILERIFLATGYSNVEMDALRQVCRRWNDIGSRGWRVWSSLELFGHHGLVNDLSLNYRGDRLVSCADDGTVRLWDTGDLASECLGVWRFPYLETVMFAKLNNPGNLLATSGGGASEVKIISVESGLTYRTFHERTQRLGKAGMCDQGWAMSLSLSRNGERVALLGEEGIVRVIEISTGECISEISLEGEDATSCVISPDGSVVAVLTQRFLAARVMNWNLDLTDKQPHSYQFDLGPSDRVVSLSDQRHLLIVKNFCKVVLVDSDNGKILISVSLSSLGLSDLSRFGLLQFAVDQKAETFALAYVDERGRSSLGAWHIRGAERIFHVAPFCEAAVFEPAHCCLALSGDGCVLAWYTSFRRSIRAWKIKPSRNPGIRP